MKRIELRNADNHVYYQKKGETKMAYYDTEKDEIKDCKKGTLEWYHERGHQIFHHNTIVKTINDLLTQNLLSCIYIAFIYTPFWMIQIIGAFGLFFNLADEGAAWGYALRMYKKVNKKKSNRK
jgi:hypothetical protein